MQHSPQLVVLRVTMSCLFHHRPRFGQISCEYNNNKRHEKIVSSSDKVGNCNRNTFLRTVEDFQRNGFNT